MPAPKILNNPVWQAALEAAIPELDKYRSYLSAMSDDIKALEKFLLDSGFRIKVAVPSFEDNRLGWYELTLSGWRICHLSPNKGKPGTFDLKPLIESPVETRERAAAAIPALLNAVAEAVAKAVPKSPTSTEPSPPPSIDDNDIPL